MQKKGIKTLLIRFPPDKKKKRLLLKTRLDVGCPKVYNSMRKTRKKRLRLCDNRDMITEWKKSGTGGFKIVQLGFIHYTFIYIYLFFAKFDAWCEFEKKGDRNFLAKWKALSSMSYIPISLSTSFSKSHLSWSHWCCCFLVPEEYFQYFWLHN